LTTLNAYRDHPVLNLLRSTLFALALIVITPPYSLIALATAPLPRRTRWRIIASWSHCVLWLCAVVLGLRYRVTGAENLPSTPSIILSKHQSAWETLAFQLIFPPQVHVLKRELLWIPFFGWGLAMMSPIAINRGRASKALRQMAELGTQRLAQGFWVVIFPEGTRVAPGGRVPYKPGGAWLAVKTGAAVVPVAHNAGVYWRRNAFVKRPGTITVEIGPAMPSNGLAPDELNAQVESWIENRMKHLVPAT
jgi:1-acyl-sn-glycerol-3-phosphate acyltransferase